MSCAVIALLLLITSAAETEFGGRHLTGASALTGAQAQAIVVWVAAVQGHTPGQRDAGSGRIATMTFAQRTELHEGMALFLAAIQGKKVVARNAPEREVVDLAARMRVNPGTDAFLKRAAVLHSDAASRIASTTRTPPPTERMSRRTTSRRRCCRGGGRFSTWTARSSVP